MKKLILAAAIAVFGLNTVKAQESAGFKGKWFIMGQAGYGTSNDGDSQSYSILPAVGNFVGPTVAVGAAVGYIGSKKEESSVTTKTNLFTVQPLVRKYWGINDKLFIFGQAKVPIGFGKNTTEVSSVESEYKYTTYGLEIAPGVDYFLSSHWTVEAQFGLAAWNGTSVKDGDSTNDFSFGLDSGLLSGVSFGLKYIF